MSQISKAADMSAGHIYHYFDGKNAIIAAIVEREREHMRSKLDAIKDVPPEEFVSDLVRRASDSLVREADPFHSVLTLEILAECQRNPEIGAIVQDQDAELRDRFAVMIEEKLGIKSDDGRLDVLFALFSGLPSRAIRNPSINANQLSSSLEKVVTELLS